MKDLYERKAVLDELAMMLSGGLYVARLRVHSVHYAFRLAGHLYRYNNYVTADTGEYSSPAIIPVSRLKRLNNEDIMYIARMMKSSSVFISNVPESIACYKSTAIERGMLPHSLPCIINEKNGQAFNVYDADSYIAEFYQAVY